MFLCALALFPTTAGIAQSIPEEIKQSPSNQSSPSEMDAPKDLNCKSADSMRTLQAVVEDQGNDSDYKPRLTAALPVSVAPDAAAIEHVDIQRPSFIPAYAFSNQDMVAPYHDSDINAWHKRTNSELPHWMKLSPSVAQYWTGTKMEPFWVMTEPDKEHPGNFTFVSLYPGGPKGWLQNTGERSAWGHPEYRYWFDLN